MELTTQLHQIAREAGAAGTGVCSAEPFDDVAAVMQQRQANGESARLGFTYSDPAVATDVRRSFPWARRLFVAAWAYLPEAGSPVAGAGRGIVARFATRNHYRGLDGVLAAVVDALASAGHRAVAVRDDNKLVDRAAAVRAGVGWWGKNTMVLTPAVGPWILLGSVVTDAVLATSEPMKRGCGSCERCLPACPTGALIEPGVLDARKCLAYWLQARGVIPLDLRVAVGDRIYGCDDCIEACPPGSRLARSSTSPEGSVDLTELLMFDDAALVRSHSHFYIPGRRARYLRRNALVAAGNTAADTAIPLLAAYAGHPDWLLRVHAVWALGRIGGEAAAAVLEHARAFEGDARVTPEITLALADVTTRRADGSTRSTLKVTMRHTVLDSTENL